ncbi:MAG: amino acid permease [Muribaculaceae bacterium]|nr:amino acid permease [Muribaculaceae bacterium]
MIGTGVFTSLGFQLLTTVNPIAIALIWIIGGLMALCGAIVYSELGAAMPRSGGEYHFLSKIYHPAMGFLSGWVSLIVGFAAPVALACMALSSYVCSIMPWINPQALAIAVLIIITVVHLHSTKMGTRMQNVLTIMKVLIIIAFIIAGLLCTADGSANFDCVGDFKMSDVLSPAFAISLIWVYYAYSGWNAAAYISGDIKNPQRSVPIALIASTLIVAALYLMLNLVFLRTAPVSELSGQVEVGLISARHIFGVEGGTVMGLLIALMLTSSISSMVFVGPRVGMTMGEDHYLFSILKKRDPKGNPQVAIMVQFLISFLMILTDSFKEVTEYTGIVLSFCSLLTVAGVFVHRRRFKDAPRPYKTLGYPVTPILFCSIIVWSIVYLMYTDFEKAFVTHEQALPWTTIASIGTLLMGALLWFVNKKLSTSATQS